MEILSKLYTSIQRTLFPMLEEELGELTEKQKEFVRVVELVRPSRFIGVNLSWNGTGRPLSSREGILRAFILKAVYNLPTTKVLIENLETNPSLRRLCCWEYRSQVPSEATFSRAFNEFSELELPDVIQQAMVAENLGDKTVGHNSLDSTAIKVREKSCRKNTPKSKAKKKRGRKSKAEKAELAEQELGEIKTRRLELQPNRSLNENLMDLPTGCDWGGKSNSQGKYEYWKGYKLHLAVGDGGIPLSAVLTSASPHDSQAAIPLMQKTCGLVGRIFYDLADSAYDAPEIHEMSRSFGHVPIIDPNKRRGAEIELEPAKKIRYNERTTVERTNSDLKDNYGGEKRQSQRTFEGVLPSDVRGNRYHRKTVIQHAELK